MSGDGMGGVRTHPCKTAMSARSDASKTTTAASEHCKTALSALLDASKTAVSPTLDVSLEVKEKRDTRP